MAFAACEPAEAIAGQFADIHTPPTPADTVPRKARRVEGRGVTPGSDPFHAPTEGRDMRDMMFAVPGIHREQLVEADLPALLGVDERPAPLVGPQLPEEQHPAHVQRSRAMRETATGAERASGSSAQRASSYGRMIGLSSVRARRTRV